LRAAGNPAMAYFAKSQSKTHRVSFDRKCEAFV
jgi:hypothetical protein